MEVKPDMILPDGTLVDYKLSQSKPIIGVDVGGEDITVVTGLRGKTGDIIMIDEHTSEYNRIQKFLNGYDIELSPNEKVIAQALIEQEMIQSFGGQHIPTKKEKFKYRFELTPQQRAKALSKRAKAKANRKKARK